MKVGHELVRCAYPGCKTLIATKHVKPGQIYYCSPHQQAWLEAKKQREAAMLFREALSL